MGWHPEVIELNPNAFRREAGRMRVYGKSDPPPAPDYTAAAKATAAGDLEAAKYATKANRINQFTPYGSLTYQQGKPGVLDEVAYNKALADYQANPNAPGTPGTPGYWSTVEGPGREGGTQQVWNPGTAGTPGGPRAAPTKEQFMVGGDPDAWSQTMTLTPQAQATLDKQLALSDQYASVAQSGFEKAKGLFENPQLDTSLLPDRAIDVGQTAQQALMARLQPQLAQQEEALRTRLANQGIGLGSTAYGREMALAGQRRNDLELQAALQGITLDQANRSAALQEQAYLQDRPLNLINALRTGAQVQNPQFQQFAQQATTRGPDLLGAANAQYGAQMDAYNADQAATGNLMGGLFGLGGAVLGSPWAGGLFGFGK